MKTMFITLTTLLFSLSSFAGPSTHFICSAALASKWSTYLCAYGDISADGKTITELIFGTCEGSQAAQEEEPVEVYDFSVVQHNPALAAKSAQWKQTGAFDVSTELGRAVLYYAPGSPVARVKINNEDVRLNCN
jgi:hypothetical protein